LNSATSSITPDGDAMARIVRVMELRADSVAAVPVIAEP